MMHAPTCSLRTRFSSRRYSMTSSWWRFTQPARVTSKIRSGTASNMDQVYLYGPPPRPPEPSADFSDSTGSPPRGFGHGGRSTVLPLSGARVGRT